MSVALIGLAGVLLGALVGGVINSYIESRRRLVAAQAAGLLIAAELATAERRIASAIKDGEWWKDKLPSDAWQASAKELAVGIRRTLLGRLYDVYTLLGMWNDSRTGAFPDPNPPAQIGAVQPGNENKTADAEPTLEGTLSALQIVERELEAELANPPGARWRLGLVRGARAGPPRTDWRRIRRTASIQ
jgi:hypothetical protein